MTATKGTSRRNAMIGLAAAAVVAGVIVALLASGGKGAGQQSAAAVHAAQTTLPSDLGPAAGYLGIPAAQLQAELRSGKTLAEIARSTRGKSVSGLVKAAVAARKAQLAAELAGGKLTPAQEKAKLSTLNRRVAEQATGPGLSAGVVPVSATYLGRSKAQIRAEVRSGKSLAEIADATPGKSAAGLIEAIVAARKARLAAEVAAGALSQAEESELVSSLDRRVTAKVERKRGQVGANGAAAGPVQTQTTAP